MAAVFDDQVFHYVAAGAGINTDPSDRDFVDLAGADLVKLQHITALHHQDLANCAVHGAGKVGMYAQLAVLAVDRNEIARLHQIDDQLQFFLAGVPAYVDGRRAAIVINHVGFAAEEMVNHPVNAFFVSGNNAR